MYSLHDTYMKNTEVHFDEHQMGTTKVFQNKHNDDFTLFTHQENQQDDVFEFNPLNDPQTYDTSSSPDTALPDVSHRSHGGSPSLPFPPFPITGSISPPVDERISPLSNLFLDEQDGPVYSWSDELDRLPYYPSTELNGSPNDRVNTDEYIVETDAIYNSFESHEELSPTGTNESALITLSTLEHTHTAAAHASQPVAIPDTTKRRTSTNPRTGSRQSSLISNTNASRQNSGRGRRNGPLAPQVRVEARDMRRYTACECCRNKKVKCSLETPCKPCVRRAKRDATFDVKSCKRHPANAETIGEIIKNLLLNKKLQWHPNYRSIEQILKSKQFLLSHEVYEISINFGVGQPLRIRVRVIIPKEPERLLHAHTDYPSPLQQSRTALPYITQPRCAVPVVLESTDGLEQALEEHFAALVEDPMLFSLIPFHRTPLQLLEPIYELAQGMDSAHPFYHVLRLSLRLLVMVCIGGNVFIHHELGHFDSTVESILAQVLSNQMLSDIFGEGSDPASMLSLCFIRSDIGGVLPLLAEKLIGEIASLLDSLMQTEHSKHQDATVATISLIIMAFETAQSHHERVPLHEASLESTVSECAKAARSIFCDDVAERLVSFYRDRYASYFQSLLSSPSSAYTTTSYQSLPGSFSSHVGIPVNVNASPLSLLPQASWPLVQDQFVQSMPSKYPMGWEMHSQRNPQTFAQIPDLSWGPASPVLQTTSTFGTISPSSLPFLDPANPSQSFASADGNFHYGSHPKSPQAQTPFQQKLRENLAAAKPYIEEKSNKSKEKRLCPRTNGPALRDDHKAIYDSTLSKLFHWPKNT